MKVVVGSVAAIFTAGTVALGVTAEGAVLGATRMASLRRLGMARNYIKGAVFRGSVNIFGQFFSSKIKAENKIDIYGLSADMLIPNFVGSAFVGAIGEQNFDFDKNSLEDFKLNSLGLFSAKAAIGLGFGRFNEGIDKIAGPNGVSSALLGFKEGALKLFNEAFDAVSEKIDEKK